MSITVSEVTNTQSFGIWLNRTNQIASIISSNTVTADATSGGSVTTGNSTVNGYFHANTLSTHELRGGNNSSAGILNISTNVAISSYLYSPNIGGGNTTSASNLTIITNTSINSANSQQILHVYSNSTVSNITTNVTSISLISNNLNISSNNLNISSDAGAFHSNTYETVGTSIQTMDSVDITTTRSAEYLIQISEASTNSYYVTKVLTVHNGSATFITEYGTVGSNVDLIEITSDINAGYMRLRITPTTSGLPVKYFRTSMAV